MSTIFRNLPSLNELLEAPPLKQIIDTANRQTVVVTAKKFLAGLEAEIRSATASVPVPNVREMAGQIARWISEGQPPRALPIINATGDLLHPELGPPPLAPEVLAAMQVASSGYVLRAKSDSGEVESLLRELTGAEAALITSSGASALALALTYAREKGEIVVSRGDFVQSPRGLRISDLLSASGAKVREVGAANRTLLSDYEHSLPGAGSLLSVRWNPRGSAVPLDELVVAAKRQSALSIVDLSGTTFLDLSSIGLRALSPAKAIESQADLVTFSTDGWVGGPPLGVILGKRQVVEALTQMPLYTIVTPPNVLISAFVATLELYRDPAKAKNTIPILSLLTTSAANLQFRAQRIADQLKGHVLLESVEAVADSVVSEGGFDSEQVFPTFCVKILPKNSNAEKIKRQLATGHPGVLLRSHNEYLCIDLRSVAPEFDSQIVDAIEEIAA